MANAHGKCHIATTWKLTGKHLRALIHNKRDLVKGGNVSRSIIDKSKNTTIKDDLPTVQHLTILTGKEQDNYFQFETNLESFR